MVDDEDEDITADLHTCMSVQQRRYDAVVTDGTSGGHEQHERHEQREQFVLGLASAHDRLRRSFHHPVQHLVVLLLASGLSSVHAQPAAGILSILSYQCYQSRRGAYSVFTRRPTIVPIQTNRPNSNSN